MSDVALSLEERERAFRALYADHFDAVLGFALRRVDRPEDAGRRHRRHVPRRLATAGARPAGGDEPRPWLYGVARRVLANHRRGDRRRTALGDRLRRELATSVPDTSDDVVQHADVTAAMRGSAPATRRCSSCISGRASSPARSPRSSGSPPRWCGPGSPGARAGSGSSSATIRPPPGHLPTKTPELIRKER